MVGLGQLLGLDGGKGFCWPIKVLHARCARFPCCFLRLSCSLAHSIVKKIDDVVTAVVEVVVGVAIQQLLASSATTDRTLQVAPRGAPSAGRSAS